MNCQMFFLAVEFGCVRRQRQDRNIARDLENLGAMPAGLIEEHDRARTWGGLGCDFVEMKLHGFAAVGRRHEGGDEPALRPPPQCVQEAPTGPLRAAVFVAVMASSPASLQADLRIVGKTHAGHGVEESAMPLPDGIDLVNDLTRH